MLSRKARRLARLIYRQFRLLESQDGAKWKGTKEKNYRRENETRGILKEEILVPSTHAVLLIPPGADRDSSRLKSNRF